MQGIIKISLFSILLWSCSKESDPLETVTDPIAQPADTIPSNTGTIYYTGNIDSLPKFIKVSYMEFDSIGRISKFRSGVGHDYSDDFEFCRSMKHYFEPKNFSIPNVDIKIYCPFKGVVERVIQEWAGTQLYITSTHHPAFAARLFHVNLTRSIALGDTLQEGELIGTHIGNMTSSDIAITVLTATDGPKDSTISQSGIRYVSYFHVMTDSLFQKFEQRGLYLDSIIIPLAVRDADPLDCNNEAFNGPGTLSNWIQIQ
ncbi:MAG: hypothetical protein EYC69_13815 [Bacteroidetes bacterium]|nr:MAG: hypothetical protein EYC69_13815 [Bacteroidota bacterium]